MDSTASTSYKPSASIKAVLQVWALYTYFLIFDQFAFLHKVQATLSSPREVQLVMAAMGIAGLTFSFLVARWVRRQGMDQLLRPCWALCAITVLLGLVVKGTPFFMLEGALIGASTGALTVLVAASLKDWVPSHSLGRIIGTGTCFAYVLANLPWVFEGPYELQTLLSFALCIVAWIFVPTSSIMNREPSATRFPFIPVILWTCALLLLVFLDSAVFSLIQDLPHLKAKTWGGGWHQYGLAVAHGAGAILAGWFIDKGFRMILALATWGLFYLVFSTLPGEAPGTYHLGLLYAVGISMYSVLLVAVPSLIPHGAKAERRALYAACVFGLAGWIGSAAGVGFSQDHEWVSPVHLIVPGMLLTGFWILLNRNRIGQMLPRFAIPLTGLIAGILWLANTPDTNETLMNRYADHDWAQSQPIEVRRGKEVYREEGCINCHSQYVRPRSRDVILYGPYRPIDRSQTPPLVGNRRQGPDLLNAGLRRSEEWHRLHLQNPSALSPGSRMPSYAHLFEPGRTDGEDLVQYLRTLGKGQEAAYMQKNQNWSPTGITSGSPQQGKTLFQQNCLQCHGAAGAGDGPVGKLFSVSPRDLRIGPYGIAYENPENPLALHLSRIIKFGLPGTSMPGHETLSDQEIADLVQFVASLQHSGDAL